ncbi:hypothetical protein ABT033_31095 [Streptomyces pharetrae]
MTAGTPMPPVPAPAHERTQQERAHCDDSWWGLIELLVRPRTALGVCA